MIEPFPRKYIMFRTYVDTLIYLEPICHLFFLQKKVFSNQNKDHLGYRYVYMSQAYLFRTYYRALDRFQ